MPSKTFIVRAHTRTVYTKPITFVCGKCNQTTTRDCFPGNPPKYCLKCSPRRKRSTEDSTIPERGDFEPTHNLVDATGKVTPVALEPAKEKGWFFVRTALDWFAGESIIKYHRQKGLTNRGEPMTGFVLESL
ncbi:MAG: hypothetical protein LDL41_25465 [Coleofasciculus sp. S288]|nr:hypothetical protein [Coleofasciculus sp. S288]